MAKMNTNRRNNMLNAWNNFVFSEQQYYHNVPSALKLKKKKKNYGVYYKVYKPDNVKLEGGDNIKITESEGNTYVINVRLSDDFKFNNRHLDKDLTPVKGNNLDEVAKKLAQAISDNADTIDGETVDFGGDSEGKKEQGEFYI